MADQLCDRCGEYLPEGSVRYTVHIQAVVDFENVACGETDAGLAGQDIATPMYSSVDDLEEDVFQEVVFMLCESCKRKFLQDPFNRGTDFFRLPKNIKYLFH